MISDLTRRTIRYLKKGQCREPSHLPDEIYSDDVFVVSYPKSGNTWVRFLLANLLKEPGEEIDFYTIHEHIPEVGQAELISELERPRLMKSHAPYRPEYPRVIYIVRDGRDVYASYYHYCLHRLPEGTTFKEFLEGKYYSRHWGEHIKSWLSEAEESPRLLLVKYEDLLRDSSEQLKRMTDFVGVHATEEEIKAAATASDFRNMKRLELEKGRPQRSNSPEVFVRKGQAGDWVDLFNSEAKQIFKRREGHMLIQLGYEDNFDW